MHSTHWFSVFHWFYVINYFQSSESLLLGNLQKGSLDIVGAVVELTMSDRQGPEWSLLIQNPSMCSVFEVASSSRDTAMEWVQMIQETGQNASVRVSRAFLCACVCVKLCVILKSFYWMHRNILTGKSTQRNGASLENSKGNVEPYSLL